ncbi:hypothetical protein WAG13_19355 [Bacillus cereus]
MNRTSEHPRMISSNAKKKFRKINMIPKITIATMMRISDKPNGNRYFPNL